MAKRKRGKCETCNKRRMLTRVKLYANALDLEADRNSFYGWFCSECKEQIPEG